MNIGENIRIKRVIGRLTQEQLAQKLALTRGTIAKWESGLAMPSLEKTIELCNIFGCSLDYLVNGFNGNYSQNEIPLSFTYDEPEIYKRNEE